MYGGVPIENPGNNPAPRAEGLGKARWIKKSRVTLRDFGPRTTESVGNGAAARSGFQVDIPGPGNPGNVKLYTVCGNQYTVGGLSACASVSFQATWFMTFADTIGNVIDEVQWEGHVLNLGEKLWRAWTCEVSRRGRRDTYQSLADIMDIPGMNRCLEHMGPRTEFYGPLYSISHDEYSRKVLSLVTREMKPNDITRLLMVKLTDSLKTMQRFARQPGQTHSVAMFFSSGATISAYAHRNGEFVVYDSHGTYAPSGSSSLFRCPDVASARVTIRLILSSFQKLIGRRPWEDTMGAWSANRSYNICIFSSGETVSDNTDGVPID